MNAALLSEPHKLQAHVDRLARDDNRLGPIDLPRGRIYGDLELKHLVGPTIRGAGKGDHQLDYRGGWMQAPAARQTILIGHVRITSCLHLTLADLCVISPDDEPAISVQTDGWRGCNHLAFERVAVVGSKDGLVFGGGSHGDNSADVQLTSFVAADCGRGLATRDPQNVAYNLTGPAFERCNVAIDCERGGCVTTTGGSHNGVGVYFRVGEGGANVGTFTSIGDRFDVSGRAPDPVLFQATGKGMAKAVFVNPLVVTDNARRDRRHALIDAPTERPNVSAEVIGGRWPEYYDWLPETQD